jgi:hypothetical protein
MAPNANMGDTGHAGHGRFLRTTGTVLLDRDDTSIAFAANMVDIPRMGLDLFLHNACMACYGLRSSARLRVSVMAFGRFRRREGLFMIAQYLVVFETPWQALNFCEKLHLAMHGEVATYRDGEAVMVIDATKHGAQGRIAELARSSSASSIRAIKE